MQTNHTVVREGDDEAEALDADTRKILLLPDSKRGERLGPR